MGWQDLDDELTAWERAGRRADFWWRDDDAVAVTPALDRLLAMSARHEAPIGLAVIPDGAAPSLAKRLTGLSGIRVMQHGWTHANHAPVGWPKSELGPCRSTALVLGELVRGQIALDGLFGREWLTVLVPPHNRIADALASALPGAGYRGLSTAQARRRRIAGLMEVNTHCDVMDWRRRGFIGEDAALGRIIGHLRARRLGDADQGEPTGILTHHLALDDAAWDFTERLLARLAGRLVDPARLFGA
jgi:hypothetical protein